MTTVTAALVCDDVVMAKTSGREEQQVVRPDPEAHEVVQGFLVALVERRWRSALEIGRRFLTKRLASMAAAALLAVVAGFIWWPLIAAIVAGVGVLGSVSYAIGAQRLMYGERRRRAWAEVALLRERQRALRAEDLVDAVTVVLAKGESPLPKLRGRNDLVRVILRIRHLAGESHAAATHPQASNIQQRREASPPPIETASLERRRAARALELQEMDAEIQEKAVPSRSARDRLGEARSARRAAERAAFDADREARERASRGLPATTAPGTEMTFEIELDTHGGQDVRRVTRPTPEEIARPSEPTTPIDD